MNFAEILDKKICKYITGDLKKDHSFCTNPREGSKPYCADHCKVCYAPTPRLKEKDLLKIK